MGGKQPDLFRLTIDNIMHIGLKASEQGSFAGAFIRHELEKCQKHEEELETARLEASGGAKEKKKWETKPGRV